MASPIPARMEFHVSRQARDLYKFDESLFSLTGNVVFANFHAARVFAQKMNDRRDLAAFPEQTVNAGQVNAMGLIDEILHLVIAHYRQQRNPYVMKDALAWLSEQVGDEQLEATLREFLVEFPPLLVYKREISVDDYLVGDSIRPDGELVPNQQLILEEMLLLWLANINPAFVPFLELFDDEKLEKVTAYPQVMDSLYEFFETQPIFGPGNQNLINMLRAPALAFPFSLTDQLEFLRSSWTGLLGEFIYRLLSSLDLIKEEEKVFFGFGPGPALVYDFTEQEYEPERFSPDKDWMPNLVLIAKNSYVWLDQLSKKYKRDIVRLDQVPDEELDILARWGFTGLWLIGLWERSAASRNIKQMRGNPDAVASAYSVFGYEIAADLGGEDAYQVLRDRAWKRGVRLASDMVPNHMGIDSRWVVEHPDWFVSLDHSPFPTYTFNGINLSWDDRVGIYLEDHYYDNSDAAVVFKRVDFWTGSEKYIYHGNDGTSMPWNDTAQLNYLLPELREAVIQTILSVARRFPIIRFDAAMTLAKKHYHRLWFPEPGSGGDIPSRAEYGMTRADFDAAFPEEFWREVVDRVAQEVPETLLLAEAFWLMEGFFVRTLGMHRVYNSAFMNMMRDEKNQEYRLVVKNTIEFDPEILKRYVNFMNNPDERTAVDQFGNGDKYFGVCTLMATMPGLPMFGHGQVEGFTEKYGMEYRRAYWDEEPNSYLVERHEREIFPLLQRRHLFADVRNFLLYDFYNPEGFVNEDVYAYSNRVGGERSLVVYHNKYADASGWIRVSAAFPVKTRNGENRQMMQKNLGEGLELRDDSAYFTIFRDHVSGMEYIRNSQELHQKGLYIELQAYQYHVFLEFREVLDDEHHQYAHLASFLGGRGVPSVEEAIKEIFLEPVHGPFRELVNPVMFERLIQNRSGAKTFDEDDQLKALDETRQKAQVLLEAIQELSDEADGDPEMIAAQMRLEMQAILDLAVVGQCHELPHSRKYKAAQRFLMDGPDGETPLADSDSATWSMLFSWAAIHSLGRAVDEENFSEQSRTWIDEWLLGKIVTQVLVDMEVDEGQAWWQVGLLRLLTTHYNWCEDCYTRNLRPYLVLQEWLQDAGLQRYLHVHRYQGILWFNKEAFESLLWWFFALSVVETILVAADLEEDPSEGDPVAKQIVRCYDVIRALKKAEEASGYQVEKLLEALRGK